MDSTLSFLCLIAVFAMPLVVAFFGMKFRKHKTIYQNLYLLSSSVYFFYSAIVGVIIVLSWLFSGHEDLRNNWNILLFFPFDFILGYYLMRSLGNTNYQKYRLFFDRVLFGHMIGVVLLFMAFMLGICQQSVEAVAMTHGLILLMIFASNRVYKGRKIG